MKGRYTQLWFMAIMAFFFFVPANAENVPPPFTEEGLLIVQPVIDELPYGNVIPVYQSNGRYFYPLKALTELLGFGLSVNTLEGTAAGWGMNPTQSFALNEKKRTVSIQGKNQPFPKEKVVLMDDDIFIEKELYASWFNLFLALNMQKLTVTVTSSDLLPIQQKNEREKQWDILHGRAQRKAHHPVKTMPYQPITWPFIDVAAGHAYSSTPAAHTNGANYLIRAGGDVGYLNTQLFASGEQDEPLHTVRMTAGRRDSAGELLGPLKATQYSVGDINSVSLPLVAVAGDGRGVMVSNYALNRSTDADTTDFIGDSMPGWDVELYRNGILLDAVQVGETGRYNFNKVPILYGANSFRLIFYGPQGQRHEETREIFTDDSILHKGEFSYTVSMNEKYKSLLPLGGEDFHPFSFVSTTIEGKEVMEAVPQQEGIRAIALTEYGVTKNITASMGAAHVPLEMDFHDYLTLGARTNLWKGILATQELGYDATTGGTVEKTSLLTNIKGINLKGDHAIFSHFTDELQQQEGKLLKTVTGGEVSLPVPYMNMVNTGLIFKRRHFTEDTTETNLLHRLSTSYHGISITHNIGRVETQASAMKSTATLGQLAASGTVRSIGLRAAGSYDVSEGGMSGLSIVGQKEVKKDLVLVMAAAKDLTENNKTSVSSSLNWDMSKVKLSLRLDATSEQELFVGTNVSFSLARSPSTQKWLIYNEPVASGGGVEARAFLDENGDGIFNGEDAWIPHTAFKVGSKKITSADNAAAFGLGLIPDILTDVSVDEGSLEDPLWISPLPGYAVLPRAGIVTPLSFPIIASSEIDGTVTNSKGGAPLAKMVIELVDPSGHVLQKAYSEFDGLYIFERVMSGTYTLRISAESLEKIHGSAAVRSITIPGKGDVFSGQDFQVQ